MKHFSLMLVMVLFSIGATFAQRTITGTVLLESEGEAIGANVVVDGNEGVGTVTEFDGTFSLSVPDATKALKISYTGYATQIVSIEGVNNVTVTLLEDSEVIGEVVVIGYETVKRSDVSAAVSEVKGDELTEIPVGNVENLLQGKSSGLHVVGANGRPGGSGNVRLRGIGSEAGSNEPLYIVDGAQVSENYLSAVNPDDIASVSVLKDAAATSIYGSSGSNGVILVTTKKGTKKPGARPEIRFSTQYGIKQKTPDNFEMMNAQQKIDYEIELYEKFQIGSVTNVTNYQNPTYRDSLLKVAGNWQDILLKNGTFNSYNLSMTGSSDKANYFGSVGYYNEDGITHASSFKRMTARFSVDFKAADWLTLGSTFAGTHIFERELRDRNNVQNPFRAMYVYNPYESEFLLNSPNPTDIRYNADGTIAYNRTHAGFSISEALVNNPETNERFLFNAQMSAIAEIYKGLKFHTKLSGFFRDLDNKYINKRGSILDGYIYGFNNPTGSASFSSSRNYEYQWTNLLTYRHTLNEKHTFNYLVGQEFLDWENYFTRLRAYGFPNTTLTELVNAATPNGTTSLVRERAKLSFFGNVRYDYMGKYLATGTYRADASSSFGSNNRYGHFFAGSVAWNAHMEDFVKEALGDNVDQLKLRLSLGTSGNETGASSYDRLGVLRTDNYGAESVLLINRAANPNLGWEKNTSSSLGVDFGLFNSRITGALDFYYRKTSDLLFNAKLGPLSGVPNTEILQNVGAFVNKGIELELRGDLVRMREEDFSVQLYGTYSMNKNKVTKLADVDSDPSTPTELIDVESGLSIIKEGEEYSTFYLVRYAGVDPATGDELYYDKNGNVTNKYDGADAVTLSGKSILPTAFGSFGTNISYKGLSLGVDFYYNVGNYTYNRAYAHNLLSNGQSIVDNQRVDAANYWKKPGDITDIPRPIGEVRVSDKYLQKGDYLRLKNVRLGYSVPVKSKWVSKVNVYAQANNLKTWTKFDGDPEVGTGSEESRLTRSGEITLYSYPQTRSFTVGLNLTF